MRKRTGGLTIRVPYSSGWVIVSTASGEIKAYAEKFADIVAKGDRMPGKDNVILAASKAANGTEFAGYKQTIVSLINGKKVDLPTIFSSELNPSFQIVLGQKGFFSNFKVCLRKSQNTFSVN